MLLISVQGYKSFELITHFLRGVEQRSGGQNNTSDYNGEGGGSERPRKVLHDIWTAPN